MSSRTAGAALGLAGLVTIVAGTFLPWVRSGDVRRNSYQTDGALQRLLDLDGRWHAVLSAWPYLGLLCAGLIAVFAVGLQRTAAITALLAALAAGAVASVALAVDATSFVTPLRIGPAVTLAGSVALAAGSSLLLVSHRTFRFRKGVNTWASRH